MSNHPPAAPSNKERNEYIPSFISKKPFYIPSELSDADYLEHQRLQKSQDAGDSSKWYSRGTKLDPASTKFRKGACENCGAMTHKTKDCLSRPRKQGAKWTGKDIQADEKVEKVELGWDAKRDRWNGYDAAEYQNVVREYEDLEALKRRARGDESEQKKIDEDGDASDHSVAAEEARYAEESDMGRAQSTATRNLRLREDTAKYLLNLDLDSARYDPKTRSMVDAGATTDKSSLLVAEDNFLRASGDAAEFERAQRYAWETQEKGSGARQHLQANPTEGEVLRKKETTEAAQRKAKEKKVLLDRYGAQPQTEKHLPGSTEVTANEQYMEYDAHGAIKGAKDETKAKSKYKEDVFVNNHTSVWGSWWNNFQWGYACCHSTVKNSYCTGEEGKKAFEEAEDGRFGNDLQGKLPMEEADLDSHEEQKVQLPKALEAPEEPGAEKKKRTLAEIREGIDDEQMEAYKRSRLQTDDPMAKLLGRDELIT